MEIQEKVYENRLRRWAKRLGLELHKSKARLFNINDRGGYQVVGQQNRIVAGERMDLTLDEVKFVLEKIEHDLSSKPR